MRQQPEVTDWDLEDVNYNTFRWITAGQGFAMGPSRVNPRTGQILDADIIFDGDFLQFWRQQYETLTPESVALLTGGGPGAAAGHGGKACCGACLLFDGHARETALAATALAVNAPGGLSEAEKEKLVIQGLTLVAMHEVGHTLGLRHNFKGSAYRSLADINDLAKTSASGASTSVMDYIPANIMPRARPRETTTPPDLAPTTCGPSNTATSRSAVAHPRRSDRNSKRSRAAAASRNSRTRPTKTRSRPIPIPSPIASISVPTHWSLLGHGPNSWPR